jgi:DNA-3-methyladenine glycosylase
MKILPLKYYQSSDVLALAKDLLGKYLFTQLGTHLTGGMIIETEAYRGPEDRASHAYGNRKTKRTSVMFQSGGICYIYLVYGIHYLLNVVTNVDGIPHAVLIRALAPMVGIEEMQNRRGITTTKILSSGPGTLTQALGIDLTLNGFPLNRPPIWIEDRGTLIKEEEIVIGPRIGISYAGEDAFLPWRFRLKGNKTNE